MEDASSHLIGKQGEPITASRYHAPPAAVSFFAILDDERNEEVDKMYKTEVGERDCEDTKGSTDR